MLHVMEQLELTPRPTPDYEQLWQNQIDDMLRGFKDGRTSREEFASWVDWTIQEIRKELQGTPGVPVAAAQINAASRALVRLLEIQDGMQSVTQRETPSKQDRGSNT